MFNRLNKIGMLFIATLMLLSGCSNSFVQPNGFVFKGIFQSSSNSSRQNSPRNAITPQIKPTKTSPERGFAAHVTVRRGDTLYSLSKLANVPINELISANGLRAPYQLRAGQNFRVRAIRLINVLAHLGDTVSV